MFTKSTTWNCFYSSPTPNPSSLTSANNHIFVWLSGERYPCKSPFYFRISSHLLPLPPSPDKGPPFTFFSPRSIPLLMTLHNSLSIFSRNFMNFCFSLVFIFSLFLASDTFACYPKTCEEKEDCWLLWARKWEECFPIRESPPIHSTGNHCTHNQVKTVLSTR